MLTVTGPTGGFNAAISDDGHSAAYETTLAGCLANPVRRHGLLDKCNRDLQQLGPFQDLGQRRSDMIWATF
jgi:hypothetical protein